MFPVIWLRSAVKALFCLPGCASAAPTPGYACSSVEPNKICLGAALSIYKFCPKGSGGRRADKASSWAPARQHSPTFYLLLLPFEALLFNSYELQAVIESYKNTAASLSNKFFKGQPRIVRCCFAA